MAKGTELVSGAVITDSGFCSSYRSGSLGIIRQTFLASLLGDPYEERGTTLAPVAFQPFLPHLPSSTWVKVTFAKHAKYPPCGGGHTYRLSCNPCNHLVRQVLYFAFFTSLFSLSNIH